MFFIFKKTINIAQYIKQNFLSTFISYQFIYLNKTNTLYI